MGWDAAKVLPDMIVYCQKASGDAGHGDPGPRVLMLELLTVRAAVKMGVGWRGVGIAFCMPKPYAYCPRVPGGM